MSIDPEALGFAALLAYVLAWVLLIGLCRSAKDRPHTHRPADDASTGSAGRCDQLLADVLAEGRPACSVAFCGETATVGVHAGHEYWPFCVEHGTPYLTEGLAS